MCNSSTCQNNKSGIGADFMCRCAYVRFDYRRFCTWLIIQLMVAPNKRNPAHAWDIIAEYFTHE